MTYQPSPEDARFPDLALDAFAFLGDIGFRVVRREALLVRLASDAVSVTIYVGRSSFQVGLEVGRTDRPEIYSLHEVLMAFAPEDIAKARCQAVDYNVLVRCLSAIAKTIRACCRDLLEGDSEAFATLRETASGLRRATTLEAQYGATIDDADRAWRENARDTAAALYAEAEPALNETRRRRLAYMRRNRASG